MHTPPETTPVYVKCERCGTRIPEQSAIEENGLLLCGECLVADVKRDVSRAEAEAEHQRLEQCSIERDQIRRQQRRRALLILCVCVTGLITALGVSHIHRAEPVQTRSFKSVEHPDMVKSMLLIGIYKYKSEHGTLPESLKDLVPRYLSAELTGAFKLFDYTVLEDDSYLLELKKKTETLEENQREEATQGEKL